MSTIHGIMLSHSDGNKEFYTPKLTVQDQKAIFLILEKYGDNNESLRGDLIVSNEDGRTM